MNGERRCLFLVEDCGGLGGEGRVLVEFSDKRVCDSSPSRRSLMSLAACMPSSLRFFSICLLRARAARSSADIAHPILRPASRTKVTKPAPSQLGSQQWNETRSSRSNSRVRLTDAPRGRNISGNTSPSLARTRTQPHNHLSTHNQRGHTFNWRRPSSRADLGVGGDGFRVRFRWGLGG